MRSRRLLSEALSCLFFLLAFVPVAANGQNVTGTILGAVKEQSGAVVPGATVTITNTNTGLVRTVTTDSAGNTSRLNCRSVHTRYAPTEAASALRQKLELNLRWTQD